MPSPTLPPTPTTQHDREHRNVCLFVLGFNDTSMLVGQFVSSPRERKIQQHEEEIVEQMKEGHGRKETLICCKGSRPCPTVSQYQLDLHWWRKILPYPTTPNTEMSCVTDIMWTQHFLPLTSVTLILGLWIWVLGATHRLMMVNISAK